MSQQLAKVGFKIQLKFATVSVRGINESLKRTAIFRQLHTRKVSIAFLQEKYSSKAQENIWSAEWGDKIYFNHGSKHSKGVAILFDPKLTVTVKKEIKSDDGRIIILEKNIGDEIYVLVNIYAPNNIHSQQMFFLKTFRDASELRKFFHFYRR